MPVPIACPHCAARARVPDDLLASPVRCPACHQSFLAPSADDLLPTVTLAPAAEPGAAPPPTARVLARLPSTAPPPRRPPADEPPPREGGAGLAVGLVAGTIGLVVVVTLFAWMVSARRPTVATAAFMVKTASATTWAPPTPAAPAGGEPGTAKPIGTDPIVAGPFDFVGPPRPAERIGPVTVVPIRLAPPAPAAGAGAPPAAAPAAGADGLCWSADGTRAFVLTAERILYRTAVPGDGRVRRVEFLADVTGLARSAAGLVVTLPALGEVCVIDPDTLRVTTRAGVAGLRLAVTAPNLTVAYGFCDAGGGAQTVVRIDLTTGAVTPLTAAPAAPNVDGPSTPDPAISPDGQFLFAAVNSVLGRYHVVGDTLARDQATAAMVGGPQSGFTLAPDGKRIAALVWDGMATTAHVFDATNLAAAPVRIGDPPVAFSADGRRLFTHDNKSQLVVLDAAGKRVAAYDLGPGRAGQPVRLYLAHPDGNHVLVVLTDELLWVELAGD